MKECDFCKLPCEGKMILKDVDIGGDVYICDACLKKYANGDANQVMLVKEQ
jgi:hypothetical protein